MNPQELRQMLNELLQAIEQVTQSGEVLSDEFQGMLAQTLGNLAARIDQSEAEPPAPPEAPNIPAPPDEAMLLWILAGGQEDAFVNYLRTYPSAQLGAILRNPAQLNQLITRLRQTNPLEDQDRGQANGIPHASLDSSNIYGYRYDPKSGRLMVRFQSGSVYGYQGVPPGIFKVFQQGAVPAKTNGQNRFGRWWVGKIPSLGAAFYNMIRQGGYPYERLA